MKILSFVNCEARKVYRSTVFWVVISVFSLLPLMLGFLSSPDLDWESYLSDLLASTATLLVVGCSFTSAWVFGREYTDNTIKDLLVKPIPKTYSVLSKFIVITIWNVILASFSFMVVTGVGVFIGINGGSISLILSEFLTFMLTAIMIMAVSTTSALLASVTKGYLAPIGLTFVIVIVSNVVTHLGMGTYFPWTIPVISLVDSISLISIVIVMMTGITGLVGTIAWWRFAEQK
ncbi:ABC transporter permease [Amphibacillus cookii]|uniref:ABC transporter permease n=1 Tax=Amphibacillus cookii TaxID=767787 RepID=UPI00195B4C2A|nr:ABC transporter permease [Amphibacillus cookii]MBM7540134.1 ABC-2 type transport system permease protein [Amphibacillus cookii]